ncbi:hypothetical protein EC973_006524 [Apophysomyces ossiformis]|uniref:Carbohydrate esterase family 16 protein n=1 Tax=Apophysomyces ossiformis TaxID=679940 RepID=A0A8H7ESB8_9FUNG|nr:hypothetical protein EC973_006524 [Apophysomyces ossiformis]
MAEVDQLFIYGDSYSDLSHKPRKTNGPLWSELLATSWNTKLMSYAQTAAWTCPHKGMDSDIASQIEKAKLSFATGKNNVHALFFGVTDVVGVQDKEVDQLIKCVSDQISALEKSDPTSRVMIVGIPPLEYAPFYTDNKLKNSVKQRVQEFNAGLEDIVNDFESESKMRLSYIDSYTTFSYVLGDPEGYGMKDVEHAYWDKCQGQCLDKVDDYLWWDSLHMTGAGHKAIANNIISANPFDLKESIPIPVAAPAESPESPKHENSNPTTSSGEELVYDSQTDGTTLSSQCLQYASLFLLIFLVIMIILILRRNRIVNTFKSFWKTGRTSAQMPPMKHYSPV